MSVKREVLKQEAPAFIPQAIMAEKKEDHQINGVVLTELETLKLQNMGKDMQIYKLQGDQVLGQMQGELQKQIAVLKQKYNLDGEWEINPEGTKFVRMIGGK